MPAPITPTDENFRSLNATETTYNITAPTVVKAGPGIIATVSIVVAGAAGTINDCATTGEATAANTIAALPAAVGIMPLRWPVTAGITVVPGAGQVVAISYS